MSFLRSLCLFFICNRHYYQYEWAHCNSGCFHLRSPTGRLRLDTSTKDAIRHRSTRIWGLDEDEIKGLAKGRVDKGSFRLGEQYLYCVWRLGRGRCLTNVAWYTGYWKQGQGFLPGHEFLGWSLCLIGQLHHFSSYIFHKGGCWKPFSLLPGDSCIHLYFSPGLISQYRH